MKEVPGVWGSAQPSKGTQRGAGCVQNQSRWPTELGCGPGKWEGAIGW